jgi:hypothetical protein
MAQFVGMSDSKLQAHSKPIEVKVDIVLVENVVLVVV